MKARLLKKLLNDTGYAVNNQEDKICVGSPMCSDLISVDKKTLQLRYALDTFREGRKCLENKSNSKGENELLFIWDKLQELINNNEILDIINGSDIIENPLPVFTVDYGILIETFTDEYGWPNVTVDGDLMYDNTYFKTKEEAIKYGIKESEAWIEMLTEKKNDLEKEALEKQEKINYYNKCISTLKEI